MIHINLLPEQHKARSRTPLKLMLAISGAVAVNAGLLAWLGYAHFAVQLRVDNEKELVQSELDGLKPQLNYVADLKAESKLHTSREATLQQITRSRISWTKKLDELIDVCSRGGEGQRHLVWFDDLHVTQNLDPKAKTPGTVRASGHSGSDNFAQVANFLEDLESSSFLLDFEKPAAPEGSVSSVDPELTPSASFSFPLALTMKSTDERHGGSQADASKAKKPAPRGKTRNTAREGGAQ
jgi:Tfp pilus assembly protein PilN